MICLMPKQNAKKKPKQFHRHCRGDSESGLGDLIGLLYTTRLHCWSTSLWPFNNEHLLVYCEMYWNACWAEILMLGLVCDSDICVASTASEKKSVDYILLFDIKQKQIPVQCWVPSTMGIGSNKSLFTFTISMTETNDPTRKFLAL